MDLQFKDRVTLITGPARGWARLVSARLRGGGRKAFALIGRDTKAIEPVAKEAKDAGAEVIIVPLRSHQTRSMRQGRR